MKEQYYNLNTIFKSKYIIQSNYINRYKNFNSSTPKYFSQNERMIEENLLLSNLF